MDCSWPLHTSSQQVQIFTASEVECTWGSQRFVHYFVFYSKFKILMRHSTTKLVEMPPKKRLSTRHRHEEKLQQPSCQLQQEKTSSTWLTGLYTRRKIILLEMSRNVQCPEIAIHLVGVWLSCIYKFNVCVTESIVAKHESELLYTLTLSLYNNTMPVEWDARGSTVMCTMPPILRTFAQENALSEFRESSQQAGSYLL